MPLCPVCDEPAPAPEATTCARCGGGLVLHDRFALVRLLGAGGQSRVYEAIDRSAGGRRVALKILSLARAREWKDVELFRRAAKVLGGLSHPSLPEVYDYFEEQRPGLALCCLAHELIDGETLAQAAERGARWDEEGAVAVARQVLDALAYLHGQSPPVIHRDLKPSNLMRRRSDGRIMLIDFDLVRDELRPDGGSTIGVGTPGFAPPEQLVGDTAPATDLYALGVTLAVLLSRKTPLALRRPGEQRLDVRRHVRVSERLVALLERLVDPDPARRPQSAREVLDALDATPQPNVEQPALDAPTRAPPRPRRGLQIAAIAGALLAGYAILAANTPSLRPWVGHLDEPYAVREVRVLDGDARPLQLVVERVTAYEFAKTEKGSRLSILDLRDGRTLSQRYLGPGYWTTLARGDGFVWLRSDDNHLQAIDLATGARLVDDAGLLANNRSVAARLLLGPGHGARGSIFLDPQTHDVVLPTSDGLAVRVVPRTWELVPFTLPREALPMSESRGQLRRSHDQLTIARVRWQLVGSPRRQLARERVVVSPDAAVLLDAAFIAGPERRADATLFRDPDGFLVEHKTALGATGRTALSRLGLDGKLAWSWTPDVAIDIDRGSDRGGWLVGDTLVFVGKRAAAVNGRGTERDHVELIALDAATGRERWRRAF